MTNDHEIDEMTALQPLTEQEKAELESLEAIIAKGLETFRQVGAALLKIRNSRLYREHYKTFENYCEKRWNMVGRHAYRLIEAAQIALNLENAGPGGPKMSPENEFQLRPLANVLPEDQSKVWAAAVEAANGQQPTQQQVEATIEKTVPPERKVERRPKSKAEKLADRMGMRIAFDGAIVPKDFSDDDRRKAIAELNQVRETREARRRAEHGLLNTPAPQAEHAAKPYKPSVRKFKHRTVEARFREYGKHALMQVLRLYFRKNEYARVCELLSLAINKTAQSKDSQPSDRTSQ